MLIRIPGFLLPFSRKKYIIFRKNEALDPDLDILKTLDPDSQIFQTLGPGPDPDPQEKDADPKPWFIVTGVACPCAHPIMKPSSFR